MELYLQSPTNRKLYFYGLSAVPFAVTLNNQCSRSRNSLTLNISETVQDTDIVTMNYWLTLSDLEWLSEIFNDRKHRVVSVTAELLVIFCSTVILVNPCVSRSGLYLSCSLAHLKVHTRIGWQRQSVCRPSTVRPWSSDHCYQHSTGFNSYHTLLTALVLWCKSRCSRPPHSGESTVAGQLFIAVPIFLFIADQVLFGSVQ